MQGGHLSHDTGRVYDGGHRPARLGQSPQQSGELFVLSHVAGLDDRLGAEGGEFGA